MSVALFSFAKQQCHTIRFADRLHRRALLGVIFAATQGGGQAPNDVVGGRLVFGVGVDFALGHQLEARCFKSSQNRGLLQVAAADSGRRC